MDCQYRQSRHLSVYCRRRPDVCQHELDAGRRRTNLAVLAPDSGTHIRICIDQLPFRHRLVLGNIQSRQRHADPGVTMGDVETGASARLKFKIVGKSTMNSVETPIESRVRSSLPGAYFHDTFEIAIQNSERTALELYLGVVAGTPDWIK